MIKDAINRFKNASNSIIFWNVLLIILSYVPLLFSMDLFYTLQGLLNIFAFSIPMASAFDGDREYERVMSKCLFVQLSWVAFAWFIIANIGYGIWYVLIKPIVNAIKSFNNWLDKENNMK